MTSLAAGSRVIGHARIAIRKAAVRRRLQAAAAGEGLNLTIDLAEDGLDVSGLVCAVAAELQPSSPALEQLAAAFEQAETADQLIDRLSAGDDVLQASSARLVGALRLEQAIPWLEPLLAVGERSVRDAAARALGSIGGVRSTEALMRAIQRSGSSRTLIAELARAAPDHFLESVLTHSQQSRVRWAAAAAAGLRRRRPAVRPLVALLASGSRRERAVSCRALGWIGARSAIPAITAALEDREPKVRASAEKALIAFSHKRRLKAS